LRYDYALYGAQRLRSIVILIMLNKVWTYCSVTVEGEILLWKLIIAQLIRKLISFFSN
jgi:hypothetical protein